MAAAEEEEARGVRVERAAAAAPFLPARAPLVPALSPAAAGEEEEQEGAAEAASLSAPAD